jgi:DNA-binding CsgD family transcriptional regulator
MLSTHLIQQSLARQKYATLSRREHEVLDLLHVKLKNREIAGALAISEETLRWHLRHLYAKTKLRSRNELTLYANGRNVYEVKPRVEDQRQAASEGIRPENIDNIQRKADNHMDFSAMSTRV